MKKIRRARKNKNVVAVPTAEKVLSPEADSDVLAVLEDIDNGNEYYVSIVDSFSVADREYVAMSAYEPPSRRASEPEFILMRFDTGEHGERYYRSIRNKRELETVFEVFFSRYISNLR